MMIIEWVFPFFFIIDARSYPNYRGRISPSSLDASANFKTIFHIVFGNSETTFFYHRVVMEKNGLTLEPKSNFDFFYNFRA